MGYFTKYLKLLGLVSWSQVLAFDTAATGCWPSQKCAPASCGAGMLGVRHSSALDVGGDVTPPSKEELYAEAVHRRRLHGHDAAQPLFHRLLRKYGRDQDASTALRLAALKDSKAFSDIFSSTVQHCESLRVLRDCLGKANFTNAAVQSLFGINNPHHPQYHAACPIYLKTVLLGTPAGERPPVRTPVECLVALFLLGWSLPKSAAKTTLDPSLFSLLLQSGLLDVCDNDDSVYAIISLVPLEIRTIGTTLWIAADWHPDVLGTTQLWPRNSGVHRQQEPVMYVGPDSLALIQHGLQSMFDLPNGKQMTRPQPYGFMDVCTGSGVQALVGSAFLSRHRRSVNVMAVDLNQRALDCTYWNFCLNGFLDGTQDLTLHLIHADVCEPKSSCRSRSVSRHHRKAVWNPFENIAALLAESVDAFSLDVLTTNPPFVPAPPLRAAPDSGSLYGLFSVYRKGTTETGMADTGRSGSTGEEVWRAVLNNIVQPYLRVGGRVGIVSEFFWSKSPLDRLSQVMPANFQMLLFVNEFPLPMETYALRRSFGENQHEWVRYLRETLGFQFMSPGLVFLERIDSTAGHRRHVAIPKSEYGSLWTPSNPLAVQASKEALEGFFDWN